MIGRSEIAFYGKLVFQDLIVMELSAVVEGDCLKIGLVLSDSRKGSLGNGGSRSGSHFFNDHEAGFPLNKGENTVMAIPSYDSISLPMAQLHSSFDFSWTHRDMTLTGKDATRVPAIVAFSAHFGHDSQMLEQRAPILLV
jgi:hypothetical protein